MKKRLISSLVLALAAGSAVASADPRIEVYVPSDDYPTIQRGIDGVANGGTVHIAAGSYDEALVVDGRSVVLVGATDIGGANLSMLATTVMSRPLLKAIGPASVTVHNLVFRGGAAGILGEVSETTGARPDVLAEHVTITKASRGIQGSFHQLELRGSSIIECRWSGMHVQGLWWLHLTHLDVIDNGNVGILIVNGVEACSSDVSNVNVSGNAGGGIEVYGGTVSITKSNIEENGVAGVTLVGVSQADILDTEVSLTHSAAGGQWGDGFRLFYSDVQMSGSSSNSNERVGLSAWACDSGGYTSATHIGDNQFDNNGVSLEDGSANGCTDHRPTWHNLGGNSCDGLDCQILQSELSPPSAPEPDP